MNGPLSGRTVVVTREQPGELSERLRALGANVVHVPLIEAVEPADGSMALEGALANLDAYEWLVVTSPNGARRITTLPGPGVRVAAVGTGTDAALVETIGRAADLVPGVQRLDGLLAEFPAAPDGFSPPAGIAPIRRSSSGWRSSAGTSTMSSPIAR